MRIRRTERKVNEMASIQALKNKNGEITSYRITVSLGYDDHGEKLRKSTTFRPKSTAPTKARKEVEAFAIEFENNIKNGTAYIDGDQVTLKEFVKFWDENSLTLKVMSGDMTKKCREDYLKLVNNHILPTLGSVKLSKIKATHIDRIVKGLVKEEKSPTTIRKIFVVANSIFEYAFRKDFIRENPCKRCEPLPKIDTRKGLHCFNEDQVKRFLNDALTREYEVTIAEHTRKYSAYNGTHEDFTVHAFTEKRSVSLQFRLFFTLAVYSGCRRGELLALNWSDVNPNNCTINIHKSVSKSDEGQYLKGPKTDAGYRTIKLPGVCFELLDQWKTEQRELCMKLGTAWEGFRGRDYDMNPIFIQMDSGKRMYIDSPTQKFKKILTAYNETVSEEDQLPLIRLHDLRHTNASHLVASGTDIETVARRLGHSKPSFTLDVYGHALEENDERASDLLDNIFKIAK